MESTSSKQLTDKQQPAKIPFAKNLAIATVAASLGLSLGVSVGDVLAANERLSSPPSIGSRQQKVVKSNRAKLSNQLKISNKSNRSNQLRTSNQFKFSNQSKIKTNGQQNQLIK